MDLLVVKAFDLGTRSQTFFDDFFTYPTCIQAAAVIGDTNNNVAAFVEGRELDLAVSGLAEIDAFLRRLQTVVGRIAYHVGQRIADQLEHLTIEFGALTVHYEIDLFAQFVGEVTHKTWQLLPGGADRLHARLHDAILQFAGQCREAL